MVWVGTVHVTHAHAQPWDFQLKDANPPCSALPLSPSPPRLTGLGRGARERGRIGGTRALLPSKRGRAASNAVLTPGRHDESASRGEPRTANLSRSTPSRRTVHVASAERSFRTGPPQRHAVTPTALPPSP